MYLNGKDESKNMYLYINFPGGAVLARISVYDAMQFVILDVHTICMGLAGSMGSFILQHTPEPLSITPLNPQSKACCVMTVPISINRCFQIRLLVNISSISSKPLSDLD
jgi:hypothetical protein